MADKIADKITDKRRDYFVYMDRIDLNIIMTVIFLCVLGCLVISSCADNDQAMKQLCFGILGIFVMLSIGFALNHKVLYSKRIAWLLYLSCFGWFALLFVFGKAKGDAVRWIEIAGITIQISEPVKVACILFLAYYLSWYRLRMNRVWYVFKAWFFMGIMAGLLLGISSNLSSALILLMITFGMTWIASGQNKLHIGVLLFAIVVVVGGLYLFSQNLPEESALLEMRYHIWRIAAFLDPDKYDMTVSYQTRQALYAIGAGGFLGRGLGNSLQKYRISEVHNDMIVAVLCEELGILGFCILIFLYAYLLYQIYRVVRGIQKSQKARRYRRTGKGRRAQSDIFGQMICIGVGLHLFFQVVVNVSVAFKLLPNTGVSLPFISYGGSSLLMFMMQIGLVLSVNRHRMLQKSPVVKKRLEYQEEDASNTSNA